VIPLGFPTFEEEMDFELEDETYASENSDSEQDEVDIVNAIEDSFVERHTSIKVSADMEEKGKRVCAGGRLHASAEAWVKGVCVAAAECHFPQYAIYHNPYLIREDIPHNSVFSLH